MRRNKVHECCKDMFLYLPVRNMLIVNDCLTGKYKNVTLWKGCIP